MRRHILTVLDRAAVAWEGVTLLAGDLRGKAVPALAAQAARTRARPLTWATVYVAVFCLLSMLALDQPVALWLKAHVGGDVEGFFKVVTRLGEAEFYLVPAGMLWVGFLALGVRAATHGARARWRRLSFTPAFLFLSVAVSGLISNAIKMSLGRYRPRYLFESGLYGFEPFNTQWAMNSFPSGHSQAAFAAMTALMVIFPRYDVLWIMIAVLVAASRVAITVHFLSDAVAGSYLAVAVTILLARALRARGIDPRVRLPRDSRLAD